MKNKVIENILTHPDKEEIFAKLLSNVPNDEINEWLKSKYISVGEKKFILSEKVIQTFKDDYLDMYQTIQEDLLKSKNNLSPHAQMQEEIQGSVPYKKALEKYVNSEVDIKLMVKRVLASIEIRVEQIYDNIQSDPQNIKMDRTLIEYFNVLSNLMEKFDTITNGNPENINIQNNINIQILDTHINAVYEAIQEILSKLDYDTSMLFMELFNEKMSKLKDSTQIAPVEVRFEETKKITDAIQVKISQ